MDRMISFPSQDTTLRGKLHLPEGSPPPFPIVIMAHGFSATINGMVADRYADVFCKAGFAVLLYDHYSFGISGGEPRQQINSWVQAQGYSDAIDFVTGLREIDSKRIAIWGDSISGGEVIIVGAVDERVNVVIAQVPACGAASPPEDRTGALLREVRESMHLDHLRAVPNMTLGPMPVVSPDQIGTPSLLTPLTAFRWFIDYGGKYGTNWENSATLMRSETPAPFHPGLCAPHLRAPLLILVARDDEMPGAESKIARMVFTSAPEPKELVELDGGHFGLLYFPSAVFNQASRAQRDFFLEHL